MARITVEDCMEVVQNRFELVALASQRARGISSGAPITVDRDNDKDAVVALREIADGTVSLDALKEILVQSSQETIRRDAYGVEEISEEVVTSRQKVETVSAEQTHKEVEEEMEAMQSDLAETDSDSVLYGGEDVEVED